MHQTLYACFLGISFYPLKSTMIQYYYYYYPHFVIKEVRFREVK